MRAKVGRLKLSPVMQARAAIFRSLGGSALGPVYRATVEQDLTQLNAKVSAIETSVYALLRSVGGPVYHRALFLHPLHKESAGVAFCRLVAYICICRRPLIAVRKTRHTRKNYSAIATWRPFIQSPENNPIPKYLHPGEEQRLQNPVWIRQAQSISPYSRQ